MSDLEWLASIFTVQAVATFFMSHTVEAYKIAVTADPSWWQELLNSIPGANTIASMVMFSIKMYTFQIVGMPVFFNILWYFMGFIIIVCIARFVRGHGG